MRDTVDHLLREVKDKRPRGPTVPLNFKKFYLTTYNTFMFLGFFGLLLTMFRAYYYEGPDSIPKTYERVGATFRLIQFLQTLEIVHAAVGVVRSSPLSCALQILGRLTVLHIVHFQPFLHDTPMVFYLFIVWSLVELIRYPFYVGQVQGFVPKPLKILRHTSWIPLYPLGFALEVLILIRGTVER